MRYIRYILASLILSLGLAATACGSHEPFDINEDDVAISADTTSGADSGRGEDAKAVSGTSCLNRCNGYDAKAACQCDAQCADNGDCCGDYIKQCLTESKPTADAGSTSPDVAQNPCVDSDGDGYCDNATKLPGDCNDKDKNINPGVAEKCGDGIDNNCNGTAEEGCVAQCTPTAEVCGDSKDNDCDGQIDEGCAANPTPSANNSLTVKYADSASRRLSYGVTSDVSSIPYVWTTGSWQTSDTFTVDLGNLQVPSSKCLYVRFNVDEPNSKWLCMANQLNAGATITLNAFGKTYGTSSVQKISLGGGCSGIFAVPFDGATCSIP